MTKRNETGNSDRECEGVVSTVVNDDLYPLAQWHTHDSVNLLL